MISFISAPSTVGKVKMNVLFLDIDGVLITYPIRRETQRKLDPVLVSRLKSIVEKLGLSIVISSAWRKTRGFPGNLLRAFKKSGWNKPPVIGWTGSAGNRGEEILQWISEYNPESYIILDDEVFDFQPPLKNIVQTNRSTGISDKDTAKMYGFLKNP